MESLGNYLRREREVRQLSVAELAQTTRIPMRILRHIENDEYNALPADVFVRGFLRAYSRALGIDDNKVLNLYGRNRPAEEDVSTPLPTISASETSHSFGIAIALVILLILFTLALSIVLRPRHRDVPVELSCLDEQNLPMQSCCGPSTTETLIESLPS